MTHFNFFGPPSISQEWLKLELSYFVHSEILSSLAKGMTHNPQKALEKGRGYVHVTHFCMHNCGLEKFWHGTPLTESNNANTLRLKLHQFNFWCSCSLQTCLYNTCTSTTNRPSGVWTLPCMCANNRQVTVYVAICFKYCSQCWLPGDFSWCAARYGRFCVRQCHVVHRH